MKKGKQIVASISLGKTRKFILKHDDFKETKNIN